MSSFTEQLKISPFDAAMTRWVLLEKFTYVIGDLETGTEYVEVPSGFVTDFATTKFLSWLLPPTGKYGKACVIHDFLCERKVIKHKDGTTRVCSRKEADKIFLEAMEVLGVDLVTRYAMYAGVRAWAILANRK